MNIIRKIFTKKINITKNKNQITIDIKTQISLKNFIKFIKKTKYNNLLEYLNLNLLLDKNKPTISPQKITIINIKTIKYIITIKNNSYILSKIDTEQKKEETIIINKELTDYQISEKTNNNTTRKYNKDKTNEYPSLTKKDALLIAMNLLSEIIQIPNINELINIRNIFNCLNLVSKEEYYPIIKSKRITLSWPRRYGSTNINTKTRSTLDIILNETLEKIGEITFTFFKTSKNDYTGNVGYHIKEDFTNNHYATEALTLLRKVLKENINTKEKEIILSANKENIASQKVILNNDGELIYDGEVPKTDSVYRNRGVNEVRMYRIKL